jgi:hypothetical protein
MPYPPSPLPAWPRPRQHGWRPRRLRPCCAGWLGSCAEAVQGASTAQARPAASPPPPVAAGGGMADPMPFILTFPVPHAYPPPPKPCTPR